MCHATGLYFLFYVFIHNFILNNLPKIFIFISNKLIYYILLHSVKIIQHVNPKVRDQQKRPKYFIQLQYTFLCVISKVQQMDILRNFALFKIIHASAIHTHTL